MTQPQKENPMLQTNDYLELIAAATQRGDHERVADLAQRMAALSANDRPSLETPVVETPHAGNPQDEHERLVAGMLGGFPVDHEED